MEQLAVATSARRGELLTFLSEHPRLLETAQGWVDGVRVADGVTFTHVLTSAEREHDVLAADDDLALWAVLAQGDGLPLTTGGQVHARTITELPDGLLTELPPGEGLIGQGLVGPPGWLACYDEGDLLTVRLRDGALEVGATDPSHLVTTAVALLPVAAVQAAGLEALAAYDRGSVELPAANIARALADLLLTRPETFADVIPPLGPTLRGIGWETFGGHAGRVGTPWNLARMRGLSRNDVALTIEALALLLTWGATTAGSDQDIELLLRALTIPDVLACLAREVERRTATSPGCVDDVLERLGAAAESPAQRAAVKLLTARAAEGAGDSGAAQPLVEQVLADAPDLEPALRDAAEYAACRGDLQAADTYLRRADHGRASALRLAVRSVLDAPAARDQPARNAPCPCGSRRKYKMCCLRSRVAPLTARSGLLYTLMADYAQRAPSTDVVGALLNLIEKDDNAALLCVDLLLTHRGYAERFLRARGAWLRDDERALIESWAAETFEVFEVLDVRRGTGVTVRALPDGPPVELTDRTFSTCVENLDLFFGRLLSDGAQPSILAVPVPVARDDRRALLDLLATKPSAQQLAAFFGPQPDPYLVNSEGHEYVDAEVVLVVDESAWRRLVGRTVDTVYDDPSGALIQVDDTLERHVEHEGRISCAGQISRSGARWRLQANSRERLEILESLVRAEAVQVREVSRRVERMGGERPREDRPANGRTPPSLIIDTYIAPPGYTDGEAAQVELLRDMQRAWLDTPNTLGLTPREAALAGGDARVELDASLADIRWQNRHLRRAGKPIAMDDAWLRSELGLPAASGG